MGKQGKPALRLIRGGKDRPLIGSTRLTVVATPDPVAVDALVREEDTWLILSAKPAVTPPAEPLLRIMTELMAAQPHPPGTVLVREGRPLTLLAVVHDFDAEPCCRPEWVEAALAWILRLCREREIDAISMPLFGVAHGRLTAEAGVGLIARALAQWRERHPHTIYLCVPAEAKDTVRRLLEDTAETAGA